MIGLFDFKLILFASLLSVVSSQPSGLPISFSVVILTALVYNPNELNEFGFLNETLFSSVVTAPVKGYLGYYDCYITQVNNETLIVYGPVQYWGNLPVNGLVQYNIKTNTWSNLGGLSFPTLITVGVVEVVVKSPTEIIAFGPFKGLTTNPEYEFNNVALCSVVTGQCSALNTGLPDLSSTVSAIYVSDTLYVAYLTSAGNLQVEMFSNNQWKNLFTSTNIVEQLYTSLVSYNGLIYSVAYEAVLETNYCDSQTIESVAVWNGKCWSNLPLGTSSNITINQLAFSDNGTLYSIAQGEFGNKDNFYKYSQQDWEEVLTAMDYCASYFKPFYVTGNKLVFGCTNQYAEIGQFDLVTGNVTITEVAACNQLVTSYNVVGDTIWYLCYANNAFTITRYDLGTQVTYNISTVDSMFSTLPTIQMCAFSDNIFVKGSFIYAGNEYCPQQMAIWNSSQWNSLELNGTYQQWPSQLCTDSYLVLLAAPYIGAFPNYTLVLVSTNMQIQYFLSPIEFITFNQVSMDVVNSTLYIISQTHAGNNINITVISFDLEKYTWSVGNTIIIGGVYEPLYPTVRMLNGILYFGGQFNFTVEGNNYLHIAKYDWVNQQWMPIEQLSAPPCGFEFGGIVNGSSVYAFGPFQSDQYAGIVGYNDAGQIVDTAFNGVQTLYNCLNNIYLKNELYFLFTDINQVFYLYNYNGTKLNKISNDITALSKIDLKQTNPPSKHSDYLLYIILGVCLCGVLLTAFVIAVFKRRAEKHKYTLISTVDAELESNSVRKSTVKVRIIQDIRILEQIGSGQFGDVFSAVMDKTTEVAVKVLKSSEQIQLEKEVGVLCNLNHPHIVRLYGIHKPSEEETMMVFEYMSDGTLLSLIQRKRHEITIGDVFKILQQILQGMRYLEENNIVHRDLALRNVLVTRDIQGFYVVKISDFGLSRITAQEYHTNDKTMPVKWTAIEAIERGIYTTKSDVWSFGVCLWELFSYGKVPYTGMSNRQVIQEVTAGYRMPAPENCPEEVYNCMLACWNEEPSKRPSFYEILNDVDMWIGQHQVPAEIISNYIVNADPVEYN